MGYEYIKLEVKDQIGIITLNRPKVWNALCAGLNYELADALGKIHHDQSVRVLILTGGDKVFAAGADVKGMQNATPFEAERTAYLGHMMNDMLEALPIPVIAAVNGVALGGGCELTLACDFRLVGKNTKFGLPEVGLGILPGAGGTQRLTKLIGATKAKEMVMLGKNIKGEEAYNIGLATAVTEDALVMEAAMEMAEKLKKKPASALRMAKAAINYGEDFGTGTGKNFEKLMFSLLFSTKDHQEGLDAFIEKREPAFDHQR